MAIDPTLLEGDVSASACVKLRNALQAEGLIGTLIGVDVAPETAFTSGWVFVGAENDNRPSRDVTGTSMVACVVSSRSHWATNMHNTARFPVLQVLIFADSTRIPGTVSRASEDADLKVNRVAKVVRKTFHDAANRDHSWPLDVEVISSVLSTDLQLSDVPGNDFVSRGQMLFNLQVRT